MKTVIVLALGVALGAGYVHLFGGNTDSKQQPEPKFVFSKGITGSEDIECFSLDTQSRSLEPSGESLLTVQNANESDNQYSYLSEEDQLEFTDNEADIEVLKQQMLDSPENLRLRKLWGINKDSIGWDDIERVAPNLTYEQKLNLEQLLRDSPKDGLDMLLFAARYPNSGNIDRDMMYLALNAVTETSADNVFLVDSLIEDVCGQRASPKKLMMFVNSQKTKIERAYQKRNLIELRSLITGNAVCNSI
ncbi:hypothetical protein FWP33_13025 [Vibrio parahaemolyticus]|nr:hypothetical protein [Vibrio parahaemolyticus]